MPLSPDARALLAGFERRGVRPYEELGVLRARRAVDKSVALQGERVEIVSVRDMLLPGQVGMLPARVYDPAPGSGAPLLVYFHGGGWVTGSVAVADIPCRALAAATGCVVVSVGYRLVPETPFPGPAEDCHAALRWCVEHAGSFGAERVAVIGDSAGANLAAAATLTARDRGEPAVAHQVLLYPCLSPAGGFSSRQDNAEGYGLTGGSIDWFWRQYLPVEHAENPYAAPLFAADLSGLPSATVVTAEYDPLRDEGHAYADRLAESGVDSAVRCFDGSIHGFFWFGGALGATAELISHLATELDAVLRR